MDGGSTELLTAVEVAARHKKLPEWKLYDLARKGAIPHVKIGKRYFFREATLAEWLDQLERESTQAGKEVDA